MTYDICILAPADSFARLLLLECEGQGKAALHLQTQDALPAATLYIIDADAFSALPETGNVLRYGRHLSDAQYGIGERTVTELRRPMSLPRLRAHLADTQNPPAILTLGDDGRSARLGTRIIPLTPTEYACLSCLLAANGQPVSREELYFAAWGEGECKGELVNLYLHYLRKKLEENGRRFIFAVRGRGYCLTQEEGRI